MEFILFAIVYCIGTRYHVVRMYIKACKAKFFAFRSLNFDQSYHIDHKVTLIFKILKSVPVIFGGEVRVSHFGYQFFKGSFESICWRNILWIADCVSHLNKINIRKVYLNSQFKMQRNIEKMFLSLVFANKIFIIRCCRFKDLKVWNE